MERASILKVLLIGSGSREHSLAWKIGQSPLCGMLYIAPGNGGSGQYGTRVILDAANVAAVQKFVSDNAVNLVIIGPDAVLATDLADTLRASGTLVFGPSKRAAKIEWSKRFSKLLMRREVIPTAGFRTFFSAESALKYLKKVSYPIVVKAEGLALGKGVFICHTYQEAKDAIIALMIDKVHGAAGNTVIVEMFIVGEEFSIHALTDGTKIDLWPAARDHKRLGTGNVGPNTGGMGAIVPVPGVTADLMQTIKTRVVQQALSALRRKGTPFVGCLFPGLMISNSGEPYVLEYNARFGDPETQAYMRLLNSDLLKLLHAAASGRLHETTTLWKPGYAVCVVLASGGYPGAYKIGFPITGIDEAEMVPGVKVFHAGTAYKPDSNGNPVLVTNGGRVLSVTAYAETLKEAIALAYKGVECISFPEMYYRTDIGQ